MIVQALTRDGVTLRFCEEGQRQSPETLVFANSLGTDLRIWLDVIRAFRDTKRIVRYDKRGHGMSDAPDAPYSLDDHVDDLDALLEHLEIDDAIVVGGFGRRNDRPGTCSEKPGESPRSGALRHGRENRNIRCLGRTDRGHPVRWSGGHCGRHHGAVVLLRISQQSTG